MPQPLSEVYLALAVAPFTALMAIRELWSRRKSREALRSREQEAERKRQAAVDAAAAKLKAAQEEYRAQVAQQGTR